jgi:hypothetical protein
MITLMTAMIAHVLEATTEHKSTIFQAFRENSALFR